MHCIQFIIAHKVSFIWIKLVLMHQQLHALTVTILSSIV